MSEVMELKRSESLSTLGDADAADGGSTVATSEEGWDHMPLSDSRSDLLTGSQSDVRSAAGGLFLFKKIKINFLTIFAFLSFKREFFGNYGL